MKEWNEIYDCKEFPNKETIDKEVINYKAKYKNLQ